MTTLSCDTLYGITDRSLEDEMWEVFCRAFLPAASQCIQDQICYTEDSFRAAVRDPEYVKFVAKEGGKVVGFQLATNNLEKARVAYINPSRLEAMFPEYVGRIYYFVLFAIEPSRQRSGVASLLVATAGVFLEQHDALLTFDFATEKNSQLPKLIIHGLREAHRQNVLASDEFTEMALGGQAYCAIKFSKKDG